MWSRARRVTASLPGCKETEREEITPNPEFVFTQDSGPLQPPCSTLQASPSRPSLGTEPRTSAPRRTPTSTAPSAPHKKPSHSRGGAKRVHTGIAVRPAAGTRVALLRPTQAGARADARPETRSPLTRPCSDRLCSDKQARAAQFEPFSPPRTTWCEHHRVRSRGGLGCSRGRDQLRSDGGPKINRRLGCSSPVRS